MILLCLLVMGNTEVKTTGRNSRMVGLVVNKLCPPGHEVPEVCTQSSGDTGITHCANIIVF